MHPSLPYRHGSTGRHPRTGDPHLTSVSPRSLLSSILSECQRACRAAGRPSVAVNLDVSARHDLPLAVDAALLRRAVEPLVRRALESAAAGDPDGDGPTLREVTVTGVDLGDAFEIEVADSGPSLSPGLRHWLAGGTADVDGTAPEDAGFALIAARTAAARIDGVLHAAACPEGGVAVTLRLPRRLARRLVA
jgi:sensor histidine kinase regulating citrate/malate metabolism